jgi:hypothetical protein
MEELKVGDQVRFRAGSGLPNDCLLPPDAIGTVTARYEAVPRPGRIWIDVDFGPAGVLWSVDAAEFEVVQGHD